LVEDLADPAIDFAAIAGITGLPFLDYGSAVYRSRERCFTDHVIGDFYASCPALGFIGIAQRLSLALSSMSGIAGVARLNHLCGSHYSVLVRPENGQWFHGA
jgi:hypothetical protein